MDLRHLRYFVAIADEGSFSRAAETLRVAQPALSLHVRNMEASLGTRLLDRSARGVTPTEAGLVLLAEAREILLRVEAVQMKIREADSSPSGPVRLGLPGSIGALVNVPLIMAARSRYPAIRLTVSEAMSGFVRQWLAEGRVDLALLYGPPDDARLACRPVLTEELVLIAAGDLSRDWVPLAEVARLPLVLPSAGHGLRVLIDGTLATEGLAVEPVVEVDAYASILALVAAGVGCTVLPKSAALSSGLPHVPIGRPTLRRTVCLMRSIERPQSAAAAAMEELCLQCLLSFVTSGRWAGAERTVP